MSRKEIKIGGLGGQGVILSGIIIGKAASIYDNKHAALIQAFGPEARGSACSAQLIVSEKMIDYPYVHKPDILITMSQDAFNKFEPELSDTGTLIVEQDMIKVGELRKGLKFYPAPATRFAEELGRRIVLNIVMLGFFTAVTGLINSTAMEKALLDSIPRGTEDLNLRAYKKGLEYGLSLMKQQ